MFRHIIWIVISAAVIVWYSTVTVYVAVRGFKDIKGMLLRLGGQKDAQKTG